MKIGIIADDLTGAADAAAPFAVHGLRAGVFWHRADEGTAALRSMDAVACSTGSREMSSDLAVAIRQRVRDAALHLQTHSPGLLYKKIDSTLKGHLRLELDALRSETPGRTAVVCPAFPGHGRLVRGGRLFVHGEPGPVLREAFGMGADPLAIDLSLEEIRKTGAPLLERFEELRRRGVHTVFCDTEADDDLDLLADALVEMDSTGLGVGSAGLTAAIARTFAHPGTHETSLASVRHAGTDDPSSASVGHAGADDPGSASIRQPGAFGESRASIWRAGAHDAGRASAGHALKTGRVLVVLGSMNPVSRGQARWLSELARTEPVAYSPLEHDPDTQRNILKQFAEGRRIVVAQSPDIRCEGRCEHELPFVAAVVAAVPDIGLMLTGGETAAAALSSLNASGYMEIEGEVEPGLVTGRVPTDRAAVSEVHGVPVLLKAGGFGDAAAIARCLGVE